MLGRRGSKPLFCLSHRLEGDFDERIWRRSVNGGWRVFCCHQQAAGDVLRRVILARILIGANQAHEDEAVVGDLLRTSCCCRALVMTCQIGLGFGRWRRQFVVGCHALIRGKDFFDGVRCCRAH